MELQEGWTAAESLLEQIILQTNKLRQDAEKITALREDRPPLTCILKEVDVSLEELTEAVRLSRSARERLLKLRSNNVHPE